MTLTRICRHPIKGMGEEVLTSVALAAGECMPSDRVWAICHGSAVFDPAAPEWVEPRNFVTQSHIPALVQVVPGYDEITGRLTLAHPRAETITVDPVAEADRLCAWIAPLAEEIRPGPYRVATLPAGNFTDFVDTHISIASESSRRALGELAGAELGHPRFRMNLWVDGFAPFEELHWVGHEITIGATRLRVTARDARCNATAANPATGERDVPVPALLKKEFGHTDFGVYAQVIAGGEIRQGDQVTL